MIGDAIAFENKKCDRIFAHKAYLIKRAENNRNHINSGCTPYDTEDTALPSRKLWVILIPMLEDIGINLTNFLRIRLIFIPNSVTDRLSNLSKFAINSVLIFGNYRV